MGSPASGIGVSFPDSRSMLRARLRTTVLAHAKNVPRAPTKRRLRARASSTRSLKKSATMSKAASSGSHVR